MRKPSLRKLADAVAKSPAASPSAAGLGSYMKVFSATMVGTETVDTGLSKISIGNSNFRYVPRLTSAWSSAPVGGTTLLVGSIGGSLIILGAQSGDTTKATYP